MTTDVHLPPPIITRDKMNIADLYSTRIQKTFDEDQAEILSILQAHPKQVLKLINYYMGMPLSYPATIAQIDRGVVDLDVQAQQAFTIEHSRSTFIRSTIFKYDVFAMAQYVNVRKQAATFVKFSYVEIMAERRNFLRLQLEPSPETVIESPLGVIDGRVCDISLSGLNIMIDTYCPLEKGSEMPIRFTLTTIEQGQDLNVNIPAILYSISGDAPPYNYAFAISPDTLLERQLSHFIFQRQIEIIREIKDAVDV
jgi:hypothetical protein